MKTTRQDLLKAMQDVVAGKITSEEVKEIIEAGEKYLAEEEKKNTKNTVVPLTDKKIKSLKPKAKDYQEPDGRGLSLLVKTNGSKIWRFRFRFEGKYKLTSFGKYPEVTLAEARKRREAYKEMIANGINPIEKKREDKAQAIAKADGKTFKDMVTKYLSSIENTVSSHHYIRSESLLRLYATPVLGKTLISDVTHKDIKKIIVKLSDQGKKASATKLYGVILQVLNEAVRLDQVEANVAKLLDVKDLVTNYTAKPQSTITDPTKVALLVQNIKAYDGHISTKLGMHFMILTALRSWNVRSLKWSYIKGNILTIPKEDMKIAWNKLNESKDFKLPLSKQALEILEQAKQFSHGKYVFPSLRGDRPMSENALLSMVRGMGYSKDEFTPHGSRAMFSTLANSKGDFNLEIIDVQLAHKVGGSVSQKYNRSDYLEKRMVLSQWWADYLDSLQKPLQFEDADPDDEIYQDKSTTVTTKGSKNDSV